ncbi:uncharacterized protein [Procambarus clarkii]|uniref:uncharacterized protein n=1 Tax=Procambarus clarkii TaxID=6728 RepID=UPI001E675428|nr:dentin sialophosphoprotein-like [Procambarus clarkii]
MKVLLSLSALLFVSSINGAPTDDGSFLANCDSTSDSSEHPEDHDTSFGSSSNDHDVVVSAGDQDDSQPRVSPLPTQISFLSERDQADSSTTEDRTPSVETTTITLGTADSFSPFFHSQVGASRFTRDTSDSEKAEVDHDSYEVTTQQEVIDFKREEHEEDSSEDTSFAHVSLPGYSKLHGVYR